MVCCQVCGAVVLGIGIWVRVDPNVVHMQDLIELDKDDKYLSLGSWLLIGFGALVLLVGVFGCVGGLTRSRRFLGLVSLSFLKPIKRITTLPSVPPYS